MRLLSFAFALGVALSAQPALQTDLAGWQKQAAAISIVRDDWGIAHVHGKTDADAVFGMIYAQAEDDFNRIEMNYLTSLGRMAEAEGESKVIQDLRMQLFIQPARLQKLYGESPGWLQKLMTAWADGLNYYLAKHPAVKPKVLTRFAPWMALSFTEGSIGGDIAQINLNRLEQFYAGVTRAAVEVTDVEPRGSNGMAIAPSNTAGGRALLLINPHTSFFFRSELQMSSDEGLNAYGAATWGQIFLYQGFNAHCGWMHTTSNIDVLDEYAETITGANGKYFYQFGAEKRPVVSSQVVVKYKSGTGLREKTFTVFRTHHGPVVRAEGGKWIAVRIMEEPVKALTQSYSRTKARNYAEFSKWMELQTNSSNNTIFADGEGTIAYFHGNYLPRRDVQFDWTKPVDGSNPATEYKGLHALHELPSFKNPATGWLYNANDSPWQAAGASSPKKGAFPVYVDQGGESARGHHAVRVLEGVKNFTVPSLLAAAYDSYLPWFEKPIPAVVRAWDALPAGDGMKARLAGQVAVLRKWDLRFATDSVATSLAIYYGDALAAQRRNAGRGISLALADYAGSEAPGAVLLASLATGSDKLAAEFGKWATPWGEINRFQRINGDIVQPFDDAKPSVAVGFPSANWGSLASFGARAYPGTKRWYGTSGNSFVAVVEFGPKVRAVAVTAGGESGNPASKHFNDQAARYSKGDLREVYFYPEQLQGHTERRYHPGE
jgi:acyl-homoserine-lactone acylase